MAAYELLCTSADVANFWSGWASLSAYEQNSLLNVASQKVFNRLNRAHVGYQVVTETFGGDNLPRAFLSCTPVVSVMSVTLNGDPLVNTYGDEWTFTPATGQLIRGNGQDDERFVPWFSKGTQNLVVQYFGGYVSIPDPLVRGTAWMVKYVNDQGKINPIYSQESLGDWSGTLATMNLIGGLPEHVLQMIYDYVRDDAFV